MPILSVHHVTTYRYKQPVAFGEHRLMLRPREGHDQRLVETTLEITPEPSRLRWIHDVFGNCVALAQFSGRATELRFDSRVVLDHSPMHALDFQLDEHAECYPFSYGAEEMPDLLRSIEPQFPDPGRRLERWARQFLPKDKPARTYDL
ncbi:MAG: transglutaminase family protein, partial [Acetobacteraceae bacterium]|nr:transglutaminase family protein [Acetobacteraceae bacterium]